MKSAMRGTLSLLLAVAFMTAGGMNPDGVHDCPLHRAESAPHETRAGISDHADPGTASRHSPSDGPCRCVGDCHRSAVTPVHPPERGWTPVTTAPPSTADSPSPLPTVRGPRHLLFELHLPNAPPHIG